MIGSSGSVRDRSFLCLLAIYAAHVVLFHVLEVAPRLADFQSRRFVVAPSRESVVKIAKEYNGTSVSDATGAAAHGSNDVFRGQLRHEIFTTSSQLHWDDSPMDHQSLTSYPKIDFDLLCLLAWIERIKNIFATITLSSSTWGAISGCAIFLLTYTERDIL